MPLLLSARALVAAVLALCVAHHASAARPKSVLMIPVDDMRPSLALYGHSHVKTPNLDKLASEGLVFTNAYVQFSYCAPSRNSFMTGRNPMRTKCFNFLDHFRETDGQDWTSLPGHFLKHGFLTLGAGKTFHPGLPPNYDGNRSWTDPAEYPYVNKYGSGDHCDPKVYPAGKGLATAWCGNPETLVFGDLITVNQTLTHIHLAAQSNQPFFIAAGFHRPHMPWAVPERFVDMYEDDPLPPGPVSDAQPAGAPAVAWHPCEDNPSVHTTYNQSLPAETMRSLRKGYHCAITYTDDSIGTLLKTLDDLGLAETTAVVVFGDHGWSLGEHRAWCKMTNSELGTRIPMIFRAPWKTGAMGAKTHALFEAVDIFPTLAELVGLPASPGDKTPIDGVSQAAVFDDPTGSGPRDYAFSQFPRCWRTDQGTGQAKGRCATLDMVTAPNPEAVETGVRAPPPPAVKDIYDMCDCHWVPKENIDFMGFAVRDANWRFVEWYEWNGTALAANWDAIVGTELYDHKNDFASEADFDNFGNYNLAQELAYVDQVARLRKVVQAYYSTFRPTAA